MNTIDRPMEYYLEAFQQCRQHEVSFCAAACPLGLDVNTFISRLQEGRFKAAYKAYRDAAGFPHIAAQICDEPCRAACPLQAGASDAIRLRALEQAALNYTKRKEPTSYNLPAKPQRIAIIGAGISGMACALRLATKRYAVTLYEKTDCTGGHLRTRMDPDLLQMDFDLQMQELEYDILFRTEVTDLTEIAQADAIYVATGAGGANFGLPTNPEGLPLSGERDDPNAPCRMLGDTGVFLGGSLLGHSSIEALADGLMIATAIDNFLMTRNLKYPVRRATRCAMDPTALKPSQMVTPAEAVYSKEEAVAESIRCLKCQCSACQLHCDLTSYVHKWPLRLRDEILATTAPGKSELHATPAVRLINSCTHCGLCGETCPEDIDMDGLIQAARFRMHQLDKMPWAFNDFFLQDMAFTNGPDAYLCRKAPAGGSDAGNRASSLGDDSDTARHFAFFPGCQLGASAPELVLKSYAYLRAHAPDTGLMLGCCGVPTVWAGDESWHAEELSRIHEDWQSLGQPTLVLACPTCRNQFRKYLPDIPTVFLYELMADWGLPEETGISPADGAYAVFDPCATAEDEPVRRAVRRLCREAGLNLQPLPIQEHWTACCSFGGHGAIADPAFARHVREARIGESDLPYITYCINCRDAFMTEGKDSPHLLNLLFGVAPHLDTVTKRRQNRMDLKQSLLREVWGETLEEDMRDSAPVHLHIAPAVQQKISRDYILEQDAAEVIAFCERTGRSLYDQEKDTYSGYRQIGNMTYWAEYRRAPEPDTYELVNAWSHRMEIELEMVWNGEKINLDL